MKIEEHPIFREVLEVHRLPFGNFYFFNNLVVGEIHEEVLFNWEKAKEVITIAEQLYGKGCIPYYLSNRINDYSIVAKDWLTFFKNRFLLKSYIIVTYQNTGIMNLMFEKMFYKDEKKGLIKRFTSLNDALNFIKLNP